MAGHSIRILQLQGIVVLVLPYSLIPLLLCSNMGIVFIHTLIQSIRLLVSQGSAFRLKGIKNHLRNYLLIIIVREGDACLSEMQTVTFLKLRYLLKLCDVTVGYIIHILDTVKELVAVLYDHQLVIPDESFLLELHCRTYAQIIFDCTSV